MVGRNPGHPPPTVEAQMAGSRPIGANIAVVVAPASWWAKHVPGEGRGAHHPRLSLVSTPPGVDVGPAPGMTAMQRPCCRPAKLAPMKTRPAMTEGNGPGAKYFSSRRLFPMPMGTRLVMTERTRPRAGDRVDHLQSGQSL